MSPGLLVDAERRVTAYHEAGHATLRVLLWLPLDGVDIVRTATRCGRTWAPGLVIGPNGPEFQDRLRWVALQACGGPSAEARLRGLSTVGVLALQEQGSSPEDVATTDAGTIWRRARDAEREGICANAEVWALACIRETDGIVSRFWPAVEAVAAGLLEDTELPSWRVRALVRAACHGQTPRLRTRHQRWMVRPDDLTPVPSGWTQRHGPSPVPAVTPRL